MNSKITISDFDKRFKQKLEKTGRWEAFRIIASNLIERNRAVNILETGCARQIDNWEGDGQSTLIWDWLIGKIGGSGTSIDINAENCKIAASQTSNMRIICLDSVIALRTISNPESIDFLYLDSFDLTNGIDSPAHHLAELSSIYPRLSSGCIIAIDDCISDDHGKHRFVKDWLFSINVKPIFNGYITVWIKP